MKKIFNIALGIVTSIGGFLDVGTIATSAQAGAQFRFSLLWALALGTVCVMCLTEMGGRLAAVSHHTLAGAIRERFGFTYFAIPLVAELFTDVVVLSAEIGGVCVAVHLLTGTGVPWWALPAGAAVWLVLWRGTFGLVENGVAFLGLIAVSFVVGAVSTDPAWKEVAAGLEPAWPTHDAARYGFIAVSIIGSLISPYVLNFYTAGAVEEKWKPEDLMVDKIVAIVGMAFGALLATGVLVVCAMTLEPRHILVDSYEQAALSMSVVLGRWGSVLFAVSLGITCFGASLQVALNLSYVLAQGFGWKWSENLRPAADARFCAVYTIAICIGTLIMLTGIDPLKVTNMAMALNVLVAPLLIFPLLVIMNDEHYLDEHTNGWIGNVTVTFITVLAFAVGIIAIPLHIFGG
jgi:Mn2+/Fe2+ NRAMP family transporter